MKVFRLPLQWRRKGRMKKQGEIFNKLMVMRDSLLTTERYNFKNALERLDNLQYPRRKPVILQDWFSKQTKKAKLLNMANYQSVTKARLPSSYRITKVQQKNMIVKSSVSSCQHRMRKSKKKHNISPLTDCQMAHITLQLKDSSSSFFPNVILSPDHLASIPNIGRRASLTYENRYRAIASRSENQVTPRVKNASKKYTKPYLTCTKHNMVSSGGTIPKHNLKFNNNPDGTDVSKDTHAKKEPDAGSGHLIPPVNSRMETASSLKTPIIVLDDSYLGNGDSGSCSEVGGRKLSQAMQQLLNSHSKFEELEKELNSLVLSIK